eukprot:TRINITY_DN4400_c0_g1_i1.p1 TRINITY_DN4400_c0_g1~~TRINITY_DN4400_c0_g1_i1.p1  ORF type:complete len:277 (+),score=83.09 TRINITY_DN4400_c0_g1_i1:115-945(+)
MPSSPSVPPSSSVPPASSAPSSSSVLASTSVPPPTTFASSSSPPPSSSSGRENVNFSKKAPRRFYEVPSRAAPPDDLRRLMSRMFTDRNVTSPQVGATIKEVCALDCINIHFTNKMAHTSVLRYTIERRLAIMMAIAEKLSRSINIKIACDSTTTKRKRSWTEIQLGGTIEHPREGEKAEWITLVALRETHHTSQQLCDLLCDVIKQYNAIQVQFGWKVTKLYDVTTIITDHASENSGKGTGWWELFNQQRRAAYDADTATPNRPPFKRRVGTRMR